MYARTYLRLGCYLALVNSGVSGLHEPYLKRPRARRPVRVGVSATAAGRHSLSAHHGRRGRLLAAVLRVVCVEALISDERDSVDGQNVIVSHANPRN